MNLSNSEKKIAIIIQARSNSKRFPNKIFKIIYKNYSLLEFLVKRLNKLRIVNKFIIATTRKDKKKIEKILKKNNKFIVESGSENNVLSRFYKTCLKHKISIIIRINSDSPFLSSNIIEKKIYLFLKKKYDYLNNIIVPSYPYGIGIEIFNFKSLKKSFEKATTNVEKEHVTPYIYKNENKFKIKNIILKNKLNKYRLAIDYPKDLMLFKKVIKISKKGLNISFYDVIKILKKDKKLLSINSKYENYFTR